jgi:hypothetical protein
MEELWILFCLMFLLLYVMLLLKDFNDDAFIEEL